VLALQLFATNVLFSEYQHRRQTSNLKVSYYTKSNFHKDYPIGSTALRRLEEEVESDYISNLQNSCYQERVNSKYGLIQIDETPGALLFNAGCNEQVFSLKTGEKIGADPSCRFWEKRHQAEG